MTTPGNTFGDQAHTSSREKQHDASVADAAVTALRREILTGEHYSGEQLRKTQLAAWLQISRNTIRQVYRKLGSEGLLTHIPHHSAFIASFDKERIHGLYASHHVAKYGALWSLNMSQAKLLGEEILSICDSQPSLNLPERNNTFHLAIVRVFGSPDLLTTAKSIRAQLRLCFLPYPQSIEFHTRYANHHINIAKVLVEDISNHAANLFSAYLNELLGAVTAVLPPANRS